MFNEKKGIPGGSYGQSLINILINIIVKETWTRTSIMTNKVLNKFASVYCINMVRNIVHLLLFSTRILYQNETLNCVFLWSHQYVFFIFLFVLNPLGVLVKLFFFFQLIISKQPNQKKTTKSNPLGS